MLKNNLIKRLFISATFLIMVIAFALGGATLSASAADSNALSEKQTMTNNGEYLLADGGSDSNLTATALTHINGAPAKGLGIDNITFSGSANDNVWKVKFHSAEACRTSSYFDFNTDLNLDSVEKIVVRMNAHFSSSVGSYYTDMGGVMFCAPDKTDCLKNTGAHTISRSIIQDQWVNYEIRGTELAKLACDDGSLKGFQLVCDVRGART